MNQQIFRQIPLYRFIKLCNEEGASEDRRVLDCGAGGNCPPLSLFKSYGYQTVGVDFNQNQVAKAKHYAASRDQELNIQLGDMRTLDFDSNSFDLVYSYNSIFHLKKVEIDKAISEMKRVLKPGGLMFVNFLSVDDFRCGEGPHLGNNQYEQMDDQPVIHSYFEYDEADSYFADMQFVTKERRILERVYDGEKIKQGFIDYIVRK